MEKQITLMIEHIENVEGKKSYLDGYRLKKFEIAPRFDL
jgi:hypothetical protein